MKIEECFVATGFPARLQILDAIRSNEMTHADICRALDRPVGLDFHLHKMLAAGLLIRSSTNHHAPTYRLNDASVREMIAYLTNMLTGDSKTTQQLTFTWVDVEDRPQNVASINRRRRMSSASDARRNAKAAVQTRHRRRP